MKHTDNLAATIREGIAFYQRHLDHEAHSDNPCQARIARLQSIIDDNKDALRRIEGETA